MSVHPAFHHVVLFRLRPGVTLERVRAAREALAELSETLPGVLDFVVTDNLAEPNGGYTLALFSTFADRAAFEIYRRHPERCRVFEQVLAPVIAGQLVAEGIEAGARAGR
jgi:quinol monooxygenase YgiN